MDNFVNILTKTNHASDLLWISRYINFSKAYAPLDQTPLDSVKIKEEVLNSDVLQAVEKLELELRSVDPKATHAEARKMLQEIGYARGITTIRWLALLLVKVVRKTLTGIYVNETTLLKLKASLGSSPTILVPTHRSYGDFILMAFVCFVYEIEIPCVAAGLDFLSMWMMGEVLRNSKAFFMRRTFQDDKLYKAVFGQYVSAMVAQGDSPIEFFIEGTRSRTGKSLKPKYGFLSMILKPYLAGEVPDIKLVPVSITYDRFMEEWLYARELLGTPKPQESTKGLLKSFSILNENFGNVYFNFGEPVSIHDLVSRQCGNKIVRPLSTDLKRLGSLVIQYHTKLQVIGAFYLVMFGLYADSAFCPDSSTSTDQIACTIQSLITVLRSLNVHVLLTKATIQEEVEFACKVNPKLVRKQGDKLYINVDLVKKDQLLNSIDVSAGIVCALYINPLSTILFPSSILLKLVAAKSSSPKTSQDLKSTFDFLSELYELEFPVLCCDKNESYQTSETLLLNMKCIKHTGEQGEFATFSNVKLMGLLHCIIYPYLLGYRLIAKHLLQMNGSFTTKNYFAECREYLLQEAVCWPHVLPVYLTKPFINDCLSAFIKTGCLLQEDKSIANGFYSVTRSRVLKLVSLIDSLSSEPWQHNLKNQL